MTECEKLFDKNVLPTKKLVKDIGDLHFIDEKIRKNYFLYDDSDLITKDNKSLINSKNQLNLTSLIIFEKNI